MLYYVKHIDEGFIMSDVRFRILELRIRHNLSLEQATLVAWRESRTTQNRIRILNQLEKLKASK